MTQANGGFSRIRGMEFNYQQQYTFLPGFWRGFGSYMNLTILETFGNYGSGTPSTELAGFKPRTFKMPSIRRSAITARC